jgi:hypothetical protein
MTLKLTAKTDTAEATPGVDETKLHLTVAEGAEVIFKLDLDGEGTIDGPILTRQESNAAIEEGQASDDNKSVTWKYTLTENGTFVGSAKIDEESVTSNSVELVKSTAPGTHGPVATEDKPSELEVGELDRTFAYVTLGFVVLIAIAVGLVVWSVVSRITLPAAVLAEDQLPNGTFGQRAGSIVLVFGAGIGAVLVTLGAWLAAIETRGRLRASIKERTDDKGADVGVAEPELKAVAEIIDKARRLRGSMAVVIAGFFILAISMWSVGSITGVTPASGTPSAATSTPAQPSNGVSATGSTEPTARKR